MGVTAHPDQVGQAKNCRAVRRGRVRRSKPDFVEAGRPSSKEIIDILTRAGVFDMALANIRRKYRIGG